MDTVTLLKVAWRPNFRISNVQLFHSLIPRNEEMLNVDIYPGVKSKYRSNTVAYISYPIEQLWQIE